MRPHLGTTSGPKNRSLLKILKFRDWNGNQRIHIVPWYKRRRIMRPRGPPPNFFPGQQVLKKKNFQNLKTPLKSPCRYLLTPRVPPPLANLDSYPLDATGLDFLRSWVLSTTAPSRDLTTPSVPLRSPIEVPRFLKDCLLRLLHTIDSAPPHQSGRGSVM